MNASQVIMNTTEDDVNVSKLTELANHTSTKPSDYYPYEQYVIVSDTFYFYGLSVIIPFGLIGNFFSICVFLLSSILRHTTTGQYLVALAIADSTLLVGELLRWLCYHTAIETQYYLSPSLGLNIFDTSTAACMTTHFLRYGGSLCSVWITIAIAVERLLTIAYPLRIGRISTLRNSRVVILIIAIISFGLSLFTFWLFEIRFNGDTPQCKYKMNKGYDTWNTAILKFGTLIIPGVLIAILTVIIIVLLYRARNQRKAQLAVPDQGHRRGFSHSRISTETQLTIMLLAVCISTTALRAPYTIAYYFRSQYWKGLYNDDSLTNTQTYVAYRVSDVFNIINYAINFIMYCLSGSLFRKQIEMTICRGTINGNVSDSQQTKLEILSTPQLGSKSRLLKHAAKASPSVESSNN